MIGDAAVDVHATVVASAGVAVGIVRRITIFVRVGHVADAVVVRRDIFADGPVTGPMVVLDAGSHDVGEGFVQCARLILVNQVASRLGDAVTQFMADHVQVA